MPRPISNLALGSQTSVVNGTAVDTGGIPLANGRASVFLTGTFVGTFRFQVSHNNTDFVDARTAHDGAVLSGLTAGRMAEIAGPFRYIRFDCTAFTSGTAVGTLCFNA